jgi:hypothetical protein
LPDLVPAVGVLASSACVGADGLDYFVGMGERNADDTRLFFQDRAAARARCENDRLEFLEVSAEQLHESLKTLLSPADAAELTGGLAQYLVDCWRSGLAPGAEGWWDDGVAFMEPWAFELGRSAHRCCSTTGARTVSCRSVTASGWRPTFPACRQS